MKKTNKKHESGRSMIEMVGVLAVMGLITAAAFVLITSAMRSQKLSRADDDIAALAAGIRLLYNNSDDFSGLDSKALKVLGFENVKPAYGSSSSYTVAPKTGDNSKFVISFDAGDAEDCAGLATRKWSSGTATCTSTTVSIEFDSGK